MTRVNLVRSSAAALAVALLVATGGACHAATQPAAPSASSAPSPAERGTSTRVLAISIDGLNVNAIRQLGHDEAPSFYRLLDEGASTLNARTEYEQTVTLPNHTGMLTGRRIDRRKGGHGVTWDDDRPGTTVQKAAGHAVASVFTRVHQSGGSTALFSTKTKFSLYARSWPQAIDRFTVDENQQALVRKARQDLVDTTREFTFLHVSLPDRAGHASGFMSPAYVDAVKRTDHLIGTVLRTIDEHAALSDDLVVVLTADHGGKGVSHSDRTKLYNYRVPFLVWGPGVTADDLYDLNPDYVDPHKLRPTYAGPQPVRNGDVANVATDLLGLAKVPGSELDAAQDLTWN
ncbi:MAG: type phosphodiesterase/nucleotide pyrophosphatase [Nocardioides sp.]|nr:type phosphodiesterase/nucleotide pyrophosphatase [Nocardioides sp.]